MALVGAELTVHLLLSTTFIGSCSVATMRSVIVLSLLLLNINHVMSAPKGVTASLKAKWSMTPFLLETRYSTFPWKCISAINWDTAKLKS